MAAGVSLSVVLLTAEGEKSREANKSSSTSNNGGGGGGSILESGL